VLPPREREVVVRFAVPRDAVPLREVLAVPVARFAADAAPAFFAAAVRLEEPVEDLARVEVLRVPVERLDVLARPPVERALPRDDEEPLLELASPSIDHLPDMTRCAASATASAMIDPSLVALDIMLVAAVEAVSAASRPASRIARRAFGLALIAAAAAAKPAASISLLIAAFASLSTVSFDEVFFEDLAIA
jgi:NADH:ubiquinone oxidoreductase subunit K